jgi:hypothetical protein
MEITIKNEIYKVGSRFQFIKGRGSNGWWEILEIIDGKNSKLLRCSTHYPDHLGANREGKRTLNVNVMNKSKEYEIKKID